MNHSSIAQQVMPLERGDDTPEEEEVEAVFQSPEWDPDGGQGASPQLRRSARKRKSTAGDDSFKSTSSKKKKKVSPGKMPKTARSPNKPQADQASGGQSFEALLLAMEGRLSAKFDKASEAAKDAALQAKLNSESLEQLESRVDANENCLMDALRESEARIMASVQDKLQELVEVKVKDMVNAQLHAAGFDQEMTAADLTMRDSAMGGPPRSSSSYAATAARGTSTTVSSLNTTKQDRHEAGFDLARRQLRLWPIKGGKMEGLTEFLKENLHMDDSFVKDELGSVQLTRTKEPRNKNKDEYVVTFESKHIRDAVKAAAPNLANYRETAGMRLQIPAHLQRDFQALMNLSYDLKKRHPGLKRNVKFDEDDCGLFMDIKTSEDSSWRRVKPEQAKAANKKRGRDGLRAMKENELQELLEGSNEDE